MWQAWRRRTPGLLFVLIGFLALWLPWARIDRVAFNYHYYVPLLFALVLLAYFLAELWEGPSRRTWILARVAFAVVLVTPPLLQRALSTGALRASGERLAHAGAKGPSQSGGKEV